MGLPKVQFTNANVVLMLNTVLDRLNKSGDNNGTCELLNSHNETLVEITLQDTAFKSAGTAGSDYHVAKELNAGDLTAEALAPVTGDEEVVLAVFKEPDGTINHQVVAGGSQTIKGVGGGPNFAIELNITSPYTVGDEVVFFHVEVSEPVADGKDMGNLDAHRTYFIVESGGGGVGDREISISETPGGPAKDPGNIASKGIRVKHASVGVALSSANGTVTAGNQVSVAYYTVHMESLTTP